MRIVQVTKADPIGETPVTDVTIKIVGELPQHESTKKRNDFYRREAERLFDALKSTLPGGTLDELPIQMMTKRASHLRVLCYGKEPGK